MTSMNTVIIYTTPAYGHILPAIPIISRLVEDGYDVIAYSTEHFRPLLEKGGAKFRAYDLGKISFSTDIGSDILPLCQLVLKFTRYALPRLISEAQAIDPVLIMHDTLSLWGRMTADALGTPAASINTLHTVYHVNSNTFRLYTSKFAASTAAKFYKLSEIQEGRQALENLYGLEDSGILSILMNHEELNLFTYPRCMHPDGDSYGGDCFFIGSTSRLCKFDMGDVIDAENLIYVSLGTVFNKSLSFYRELIKEFAGTRYTLFISCGDNYGRLSRLKTPDNFVLTRFANQAEALKRAKLFITAGGMNSLCEAAAAGVPCLMVPQQGEQEINADMMEKIGGGIQSHGLLYEEGAHLIRAFSRNEKLINVFSQTNFDRMSFLLDELIHRKR